MKYIGVLVLGALAVTGGPAAFAQDKVGIEVCDTFLEKYQACVKDKAGDQRAQFEQMIGQLRTQWKQMAADAQTNKPISDRFANATSPDNLVSRQEEPVALRTR